MRLIINVPLDSLGLQPPFDSSICTLRNRTARARLGGPVPVRRQSGRRAGQDSTHIGPQCNRIRYSSISKQSEHNEFHAQLFRPQYCSSFPFLIISKSKSISIMKVSLPPCSASQDRRDGFTGEFAPNLVQFELFALSGVCRLPRPRLCACRSHCDRIESTQALWIQATQIDRSHPASHCFPLSTKRRTEHTDSSRLQEAQIDNEEHPLHAGPPGPRGRGHGPVQPPRWR